MNAHISPVRKKSSEWRIIPARADCIHIRWKDRQGRQLNGLKSRSGNLSAKIYPFFSVNNQPKKIPEIHMGIVCIICIKAMDICFWFNSLFTSQIY